MISHFAEQNISLYAFVTTNAVFAKKEDRECKKTFPVLFFSADSFPIKIKTVL